MAGKHPETRLRWSSQSQPGICRLRCGRGFRYLHANGRPVKDAATLDRIKALAVPPAYEQVWICRWANGHLQATGVDSRQRRQYRYHPQWRRQRDADKFSRMVAFGRALPALRRRLRQDLSGACARTFPAPVPALVPATTCHQARTGSRCWPCWCRCSMPPPCASAMPSMRVKTGPSA